MTLFQSGDIVEYVGAQPVQPDAYLELLPADYGEPLEVGDEYVVAGQHARGCVVYLAGSSYQHQANWFRFVRADPTSRPLHKTDRRYIF